MPGLLSRFARPPALPYQDYHDDGAAQEDSSGSVAGDSVAPTPDAPTLRKFYRDMRGKGWQRQHGWSTPDDDAEQVYMDEFDGVTVGPDGRVNQIKLPDNNLSMTSFFFSPGLNQLSNLRCLTVLDLSNNSLGGSFPPCVKELRALEELDLSRNAFYGPIPNDVELWRLPGLRRLQLSNNRFSGRIPNELKESKTLELLDCSNNNISDCLSAWACIGALHASASDPHPSEVLVMMMDAPPVLMLMQDEAIREANARLRATAWMRSHLAIEQEHGRPHARHLGRVGVTLVELPQSKSASILKFGEMEQLPKAVLGAPVDGAQVSGDDFPHMVVAVNTDTAATARACGDHGPLQPPHPTFIVQGDELFDGSMKAFHEQVIKRNKAFGIVVGWPLRLCWLVYQFIYVFFAINLCLTSLPFLLLVIVVGEMPAAYLARSMWAGYVGMASRRSEKMKRVLLWAAVCLVSATVGTLIVGNIIIMISTFYLIMLVPVAVISITVGPLLDCCYDTKEPILTLTVRPTDERLVLLY